MSTRRCAFCFENQFACVEVWFAALCQELDIDYVLAQPVVHYTFIPLVIVLGMTCTEPRPTLAQLLGPM